MATPQLANGWTDAGNGTAKNTATGQMLPYNHPLYQQALAKSGAAPAAGAPATPPAQTTVPGQATAASAYSPTPQAAPGITSTNQGTQDVVRNSYLQQATQGTNINMNDPVIRQQQDAFEAANERSRQNQIADTAEAANAQGIGTSGAVTAEDRLINEHASQNSSGFAAQLAASELSNRRDEIKNALSGLSGMINGDQARQLQLELAKIEEKLGYADLSLRGELGRGGLANDRLSITNQNTQANNRLGFDIGNAQAGYNQDALLALLRG